MLISPPGLAADDSGMDITAATSVTVLPATAGRRWFTRRPASAVPAREPGPASDVTVLEATRTLPPGEPLEPPTEPAPLAAFGRWMADFDATGPASAQPVSTPVTQSATPDFPNSVSRPSPVTVHPGESSRIAELTRDLRELTAELETVRQRHAAERMSLLEQLAGARDARRAAETELAAVQAVLEAAERKLPAPRRGQLHAVS